MFRRTRAATLSALVIVLAASTAACGGGGSAATSGPGGTTAAGGTATSGPAATPTAAATVGATGAAGGGSLPTGMPVTDLARLCSLLGPGDFANVAIAGAGTATVNSDGPGSAYCSFTARSAAQGGIEFDVFVTDDPNGTFNTIRGETLGLHEFLIVGADESLGTEGVVGQADRPASVVARKGKLVFTIAAPAGTFVPAGLTALALEVLARGAALAG